MPLSEVKLDVVSLGGDTPAIIEPPAVEPDPTVTPDIVQCADELDSVVERLSDLGQLSLEGCRRAAFAIVGEYIVDNEVREVLRGLYAPSQESPLTSRRTRVLDGGLQQ